MKNKYILDNGSYEELPNDKKSTWYRLKQIYEDFQVTEVSFPLNTKPGSYTYVCLIKRGITSMEAIVFLARHYKIPENYISAAGMKDEHAVTTQLLSIKNKKIRSEIIKLDQDRWLKIKKIGTGDQVIPKGHLIGNIFNIVIRHVDKNLSRKIKNYFQDVKTKKVYIINYFDKQRFGKPNGPYISHKIGQLLKAERYQTAIPIILKNKKINNEAELQKIKDLKNFSNKINLKKILAIISRREFAFYISSYHAMKWNKMVSKIIKDCCKTTVIFGKNHPCHNCVVPEQFIYINLPINHKLIDTFYNTERDTVVSIVAPRSIYYEVKFFLDNIVKDDLNTGKNKVKLKFFLPSGAYATNAVHQFLCQLTK